MHGGLISGICIVSFDPRAPFGYDFVHERAAVDVKAIHGAIVYAEAGIAQRG